MKASYKQFEKLLKKNNVTAYKVGVETGITQSTFTDWKNGRSKPKIEKIIKIANFFEVGVDYFYKG